MYTLTHVPVLIPSVRTNNRSNYKLSKQRKETWQTFKDNSRTLFPIRCVWMLMFRCHHCLISPPSLPLAWLFPSSPFLSFSPLICSASHSQSLRTSVCRSNRHSVGGSQGGSPGCPRGVSLTNGELNEEQNSGPSSSSRLRSSKSHSSPGCSTGKRQVWFFMTLISFLWVESHDLMGFVLT